MDVAAPSIAIGLAAATRPAAKHGSPSEATVSTRSATPDANRWLKPNPLRIGVKLRYTPVSSHSEVHHAIFVTKSLLLIFLGISPQPISAG